MHTKELNKDTTKRYQRKYWGNSTSLMRFNKAGKPIYCTGKSDTWTPMGPINRTAEDWYEIDSNYEEVIRVNKDLIFSKKKSTIQKTLDKLNKEINTIEEKDPDPLDRDSWRKLFNSGIRVEAAFANGVKPDMWNEAKTPVSFKHKNDTVKFRRKKV